MSFGQKMLEKYGYKEGEGLGKNSNGITVPIKANFKFDNSGLGDKGPVREDHWWERVFNEASSNVNVKESANGIAMDLKDKDGVEITNKSFSLKKLKKSDKSLQYGSFLKSATLLANVGKEEEIEGHLSTTDIEIKPIHVLSDADLFKACNGRTAHKGARHGLNLTGKLQRIADQEKLLLERMKLTKNKHEVFREPAAKRPRQHPLVELNSSKDETSDDNPLPIDSESDYILRASRKRKKRDKQQEAQLVSQISGIGLEEMKVDEPELKSKKSQRIVMEADPEEPYNGTPVRKKKKKKSKPALEKLESIQESSEETPKRQKKKKGKRRLDDDDELMNDNNSVKYLKAEAQSKPSKKVKLNDSYEASDDDKDDVVDRINAERGSTISKEKNKTGKKKRKRQGKLARDTAFSSLQELEI